MERLSTIVIQKLLDAFFLGLDAVDEVRRRIDKVLGRPESGPFETTWPEPEPAPAKGNGESVADADSAAEAAPPADRPVRKKAAPRKQVDPGTRPKVPIEIQDLADKIKGGQVTAKALATDDELAGKRMLARIVYVLGAAEKCDLGGLTSTEIAHVLTFGRDIDTFGTNISRAIRQGTAGLIDRRSGGGGDTHRYTLTDEGRAAFDATYCKL
ncbi:MAG: hypothetical protein JXR83_04435 [Deltaproteobacteria bacterium]|nr:hypothetical protein [Deltaproteobacteria bacterium]